MKISKYRVGSRGLKIALITDLHTKSYTNIITTVQSLNPDLIAVAGDLTYGFKQYDKVDGFLKACGDVALTFVSLDNHGVGEIIEPMCLGAQVGSVACTHSVYGVTLLDNTYTDVAIKGITLRIGGLS